MFKKILMSGLVLGALAATVGAGAYSAFTDTGTATGTVGAATIDVLLNGVNDATVTFAVQPVLPGETASTAVSLYNNGNRNISVAAPTFNNGANETSDPGADCWDSALQASSPDTYPVLIGPGGTVNVSINALLNGAVGNECQANTWSVAATFVATGY